MKKLFIGILGLFIAFGASAEEEYHGFKDQAEYEFYFKWMQQACKDVSTPAEKCTKIEAEDFAPWSGTIMACHHYASRASVAQDDAEWKPEQWIRVNKRFMVGKGELSKDWLDEYSIAQTTMRHETRHLGQPFTKEEAQEIIDLQKTQSIRFWSLANFGFASLGAMAAGYYFNKESSSATKKLFCGFMVYRQGKIAIESGLAYLNNRPVLENVQKRREKISFQKERDADIWSFTTTKCSDCVEANTELLTDSALGYLTPSEIRTIAAEHRARGLLCNTHRAVRFQKAASPELIQRITLPHTQFMGIANQIY